MNIVCRSRTRLSTSSTISCGIRGGDGARQCAQVDELGELRAVLTEPKQIRAGGVCGQRSDEPVITVHEHTGRSALEEAAPWLDQLHRATGTSRTAQVPWLSTWIRAFSQWEPWVVTLMVDDQPHAIAPLARRKRRLGVEVTAIGHFELQESPVVALDDAAARELGDALIERLEQLSCRWMLRLGQLPPGSGVSAAFTNRFGSASIEPGSGRPVLRFTDSRPPDRWLSRNTKAAVAKARNRIAHDGRRLEIQWLDSWSSIEPTLPDLLRIHRSRDLELRGFTRLDDPRHADLYHQVIQRHAGDWRLLAVRIDGQLAGYALGLIDGSSLHVAYNHVSPEWRRYSAGLLANAELVLRAAADPSLQAVDWGRVVQRYKLSLSNELIETEALVAYSSVLLRAELAWRSRLGRMAGRSRLARLALRRSNLPFRRRLADAAR